MFGESLPTPVDPLPFKFGSERTNQGRFIVQELGKNDDETRQVLFTLAGDPSPSVREQSLEALQGFKLNEEETLLIENLLSRQADDLRRGAIQILLELPDRALFKSAKRLLEQKNENQHRAGLELMRECIQSGRITQECRLLASEYKHRSIQPESDTQILLEGILSEEVEKVSLDDALGLMNPQKRSKPKPPQSRTTLFGRGSKVELGSKAAVEILKSLENLIDQHRTDTVELAYWETKKSELLGNVSYGFPNPDPSQPLEQDLVRLPLRETWESWWQNRPADLRDPDGFELFRASAILQLFQIRWSGFSHRISEMPKDFQGFFDVHCDLKLNYESIISSVLNWMVWSHPVKDEVLFLLDALETSISRIPKAELTGVKELVGMKSRSIPPGKLAYLQICRWHRKLRPEAWQDEHHARVWSCVRWLDEPKQGLLRHWPHIEDALFAQRGRCRIPG